MPQAIKNGVCNRMSFKNFPLITIGKSFAQAAINTLPLAKKKIKIVPPITFFLHNDCSLKVSG
jgi:hypothetical protein